MSNESERIEAEANNHSATSNAKTAIQTANLTKEELMDRMKKLEGSVLTLSQQVQQLTQKYHILMSKSFHGGSTERN